jgi:hypothetical protein
MLDKNERLELIRQSEKSNFAEEETQQLLDWAMQSKIDMELLNLLFKGYVEISKIENGVPSFAATLKGKDALKRYNRIDDTGE